MKQKGKQICFTAVFIILMIASDVSVSGVLSPSRGKSSCNGCNVVIILVDALRYDHLGCYGYHRDTSPNIDALSRRGRVFTNAVSQATWTKPSVTSLFVSDYVSGHNITRYSREFDVEGADNVLPDTAVTLAEVMSENGYTTAGIIGNNFIQKGFGLEQGFSQYDFVKGRNKDTEITDRAVRWIEKNQKERFFLYLHYMAPHSDYDPPEQFRKMFKPHYDGAMDFTGRHKFDVDSMRGEDIDELVARYDGEIRYVDSEIGRLVDYLNSSGLMRRTYLVLLSDHGEALAESGYVGHSRLLNTIVQVPLIIVDPAGPNPARTDRVVESIDTGPTILSALGLKTPDAFQGRNVFGGAHKRYAYIQGASRADRWHTGIRTRKLIFKHRADRDEVYDIIRDPYEHVTLALSPRMIRKLFFKAQFEFTRRAKTRTVAGNINTHTMEQLRALGYVN